MAKYLLRKAAAVVAAFSLPVAFAIMPTIDRPDVHQRAVEIPSTEMLARSAQTQRDVEAQESAMLRRNAAGDYGEFYE